MAAPIIVTMASFTMMQFFDRVFLARYGSVPLRAALPAGIMAFTLTSFFQTLAGYAGTFAYSLLKPDADVAAEAAAFRPAAHNHLETSNR